MSTFLLNVPPYTEILAMPLQYRTWVEFMYEIVSYVPPRTKILESLLVQLYIVHYSCTRAVQYLNERKMGMQFYVINPKYINFAVIFQKNCTVQIFIIHWLRAGPGRKKNFCWTGRKFRPGWHLYFELFNTFSFRLYKYGTFIFSNIKFKARNIFK